MNPEPAAVTTLSETPAPNIKSLALVVVPRRYSMTQKIRAPMS
jgi:hypothetical protein